MKITVLGAAGGEVTGSAFVETQRARVLVDCGLFQGGRKVDELNGSPLEATVMPLDAVRLTHAHLDHTGRLPLLVPTDLLVLPKRNLRLAPIFVEGTALQPSPTCAMFRTQPLQNLE